MEKCPTKVTSYQTYIKALCSRNPCLLNLYNFLSNPHAQQHGCQISALDFREGVENPILRTNFDEDLLAYELTEQPFRKVDPREIDAYQNHSLLGRILIIEDLTKSVIELLATELEIDPLFFAMHLHTIQRAGMQSQAPDQATLPSRLLPLEYINISYHRAVTSDTLTPFGGKLVRDTVLDRKLVFLQSTNIGLAQHCVSLIRIKSKRRFWICLMLVDPPIAETFFLRGQKNREEYKVQLKTKPFLGTYEDFIRPPPYSSDYDYTEDPKRGTMLNDLQYYWSHYIPPCFDPKNPSLQSLAYYPLKIIAAEWTKYIAVMHHCIKRYEYQNEQLPELDQFNMDLRELQGWRRRSMMSQQKIQSVIHLIQYQEQPSSPNDPNMRYLLEDFKLLSTDLETAGRRLETMLPAVMTFVQIADARRSFAETANITRLTVLALVFVPLTYISSLFSMNSTNAPGSRHFWVYFAVAVPVTLLTILIARPPVSMMREAIAWLKERRKSEKENSEGLRETEA